MVASEDRVEQHFAGSEAHEQRHGLGTVASLAAGGNQAHGIAQQLDAGVEFGTQADPLSAEAPGGDIAFFGPPNADASA